MRTEKPRWSTKSVLRKVTAAVVFFIIATGFNTCGEGRLPPKAPAPTGTINVLGEAA